MSDDRLSIVAQEYPFSLKADGALGITVPSHCSVAAAG
jgi:hypothetical protein